MPVGKTTMWSQLALQSISKQYSRMLSVALVTKRRLMSPDLTGP